MRRKIAGLLGLVLVLSMFISAFGFAAGEKAVYIVQLVDDPVVAYDGDIAGYQATKPGRGEHFNPNSARVKKYVKFLDSAHTDALSKAGGEKFYDYYYSFNGFAALLTPAQALAMKKLPGVVMVFEDELRYATTDNSPEFLGLTAGDSLWNGYGYLGEDVVVGVIDTGIWPEHPSFSDQEDLADRPGSSGKRTQVYDAPPADWYGTCQSGELWSQDDCNNKLIGARYFLDGFGHHGIIFDDYKSARDADGHGSHTASTAAGNAGVPASILGSDLGEISGMAPRARIAVYKALWNDQGGYVSDLTAAIDQAVADGVDVINYSIGSSSATLGSDDIAFLYAADAGVFVATSAGNSGPGASTIGSPSWDPWVTTVGANYQDRTFESYVTLGDASMYTGLGVGVTEELPLVDAADAGNELCAPGSLDTAVVSGKIVLCKRGDYALVEKSQEVLNAGGAGMILYNQAPGMQLYLTTHAVPAAHLSNADGLAIKDYIAVEGSDAVATIDGGHATARPAPWMVDFSSRGPNGGAMDIIKPDITAPGFGILAAYSPTPFLGGPDQLFAVIQGTSMSSPHVAGIFALLKQAHPDWTPEMAKSAIMTTARQDVLKQDGATPADPFDMGGGGLNPNPAVDPGLVYEAGFYDYLAFLCGNNPANISSSTCQVLTDVLGLSTDPSALNYPSIGIAELAGTQTVERTVTNVGPAGTYTASVDAPAGITVSVSPSSLTLAEGESGTFEVTFTATSSAAFGSWAFGSLTWNDGAHNVRSPMAVKPVAIAAPDEVLGKGEAGSASFDVTFGYAGDYTAAAHGLEPATVTSGTVVQDPDQTFDKDDGYSNLHEFTLSGAAHFRIAMPPDAVSDPNIDLDIFVYDPSDHLVASSTSGGTDELIDIPFPADGTWKVYVHGWQTVGASADYDLYTWVISATPGGSMTVDSAPTSASIGATATIDVSWTGAAAGQWYLGAVSHSDAVGFLGLTLVNVDNR
jgi:subtilisin family serine protease